MGVVKDYSDAQYWENYRLKWSVNDIVGIKMLSGEKKIGIIDDIFKKQINNKKYFGIILFL